MIKKQNNSQRASQLIPSVAVLIFASLLVSCSVETEDVSESEPAANAAVAPESIPDFSGIYEHSHATKSSRGGDGLYLNDVEPTAEAQAVMDAYDPADDFVINCEPHGPKRQLLHPYPIKITQTAESIDIWYEGWNTTRTIHLNTEFPDNIEASKLGYSIGHFEGNDLVIETIAHMGGFINEVTGFQYSEDAHLLERYTRVTDPEDNHIELRLVITDPRRFSEPMIIGDAWTWDPELLLLDYECLIPEEHGLGR